MNTHRDALSQQSSQYVLSLQNEGYIFINVIKSVMPYKADQYHNESDYINRVLRVYNELVTQTLLAMDGDNSNFALNLLNLPSFSFFTDIPEFMDTAVMKTVSDAFRIFSMWLFFQLQERTNYERRKCDYLLEAVTSSYIVVWKIVKA